MQKHGGAAAEAAITGFERKFLIDIKVDWDGDGSFGHPLSELSEYVEDVSLDRALSGSAPDELMLVEGAVAAELVITLGGEYNNINLTTVFSPYNTRSPLFNTRRVGSEITYAIIVETEDGAVRYQQFVGNITEITPNRGENSIEIRALDRAEKLRKPVRLVPWAVSDEHVNYGEVDSQLAFSHWVIDNCLRLCDVSPGPKRPTFREEMNVPDYGLDGVQVWISGNGSYLPTVGYLDNPNADTFPRNSTPMYRLAGQRHPLTDDDALYGRPMVLAGLGLPVQQRYNTPGDQGIIRYWSADQDLINPTARHVMGFTLNTIGTNGTAYRTIGDFRALEVFIGMGRALEIWIGSGKVWSKRINYANGGSADTSAKVDIPTGRDYVDIHVEWDNTPETGSRCYVRAGESSWMDNVGSPVTSGSDLGADQIKGRVSIGQALNMSDVFYAVRNYYTTTMNVPDEAWRPAKYAAVLDIGKNRFTHMPNPGEAKEAWEIIKEVAAAEFGAVFWDEDGIFHFWNTDTIADMQFETVRQLTLDDVSGLLITDNLRSVKNIYTVQTAKKRAVMKGAVYESKDVNEFYVPGGTERKFKLFLDNIESPLTFKMQKYISKREYDVDNFWQEFTDDITHGYCIQYYDSSNATWRELHDREGVDIRVYFTSEGFITVDIWNGWAEPIRLAAGSATDDPRPAFRFDGTEIYDDATLSVITRDRDSIVKYGSQNLELSGDWYQDTYGAHDMIQDLLVNSREPKPSTDNITIAGDPRLQLGDTIGIADPGGIGEGMRVQIIGINRRFGRDTGLEDELTVEMLNPSPEDLPEAPATPTNLTGTFLAPRTLQLSWDEVSNATEYKLYDEINEPGGVAQGGIVLTTSTIRTNLEDKTYRFKVTAINSMGESDFSNIVEVTAPYNEQTPTVDAPYQILNIGPGDGQNHFNVGIGTDIHRDYDQAQIASGLNIDPWFTLNADNTAAQFSAPLDGATTSGSTTYARSELRELNPDGTDMGFDPLTNRHYMRGKTKITQVPPNKPDVVVAQLHSGTNDAISIRTQNNAAGQTTNVLLFRVNGTSSGLPKMDLDYQVGEEFEWMIELVDGTINVYFNDMLTPFWSEAIQTTAVDSRGRDNQFYNATATFFFKAGCYNQSNETTDDPAGPTFRVELRDLKHWHTGWPEPTDPTEPTPPQVTVDAGADTTIALGAAVTRTATVTNSTATGSWKVSSAPAGSSTPAGTTIGASAALSWTPPVEGNYTLRYTLSTGEYDEFEVTVGGSTPTGGQLPAPTIRQYKTGATPSPFTSKNNAVTLNSTAQAGNLLVYVLAGDRATGDFSITDDVGGSTGWNVEVEDIVTDDTVCLYVAWKVAEGGEKTITGTTTGAPYAGNTWLGMELDQDGSPAWGVSAKAVNGTDGTPTLTTTTGTTGTISYRGLSVAVAAVGAARNLVDPSFSGHTVLYAAPSSTGGGGGAAALTVATTVAQPGGTTSSTFTNEGSEDAISAALIVFGRQGNAN